MHIVNRSLQFARGALLSFGPSAIRRRVWNKEYSENKWHFAYNTADDCVYAHLEKFARNGRILDLGCGSGNTSTELKDSAYQEYVGVDISEVALEMARKRSQDCGRQNKNSYACSDFFSYEPSGKFDVILFRESMYHVPLNKIKPLLDKLAPSLKEGGVFIVRLFVGSGDSTQEKQRPSTMMKIMETDFDVVEKARYKTPGLPEVLVFRPKAKTI